MNNEQRELTGRIVVSDQVATDLLLTPDEQAKLDAGSAVYDQILSKLERQNGGQLPFGAEDDAVEEACKLVPGYGEALDKWAQGFRKVFTSGQG